MPAPGQEVKRGVKAIKTPMKAMKTGKKESSPRLTKAQRRKAEQEATNGSGSDSTSVQGSRRGARVKATVLVALLIQISLWSQKLEPGARDLDSVELFGGAMEITRAMYEAGRNAVSFDKKYHVGDKEDFLTGPGFTRALRLTLRLKRGASLWGAPNCAPWGWIGRSTTKRSQHMPSGDLFNPAVRRSNRMVVLLVMLYMLAMSRGVNVWLEQPSSTVMNMFTPMMEFIDMFMRKPQVWLKAFDSTTMKPLTIWSSSPIVHQLKRDKPRAGKTLCVPSRNGGVDGVKDNLTASAAYPKKFGRALAQLMLALCCQSSDR